MTRLRPEARPAGWPALDKAQKNAFGKIAGMILEAVGALELSANEKAAGRRPAVWLSKDRTSRSAFLSGGRGSGKTTVLASLIETMREPPAPEMTREAPEVASCVETLRRRAVWLEPIDMETTPVSINLLLTILVRVEQATRDLGLLGGGGASESDRRPRGLLGADSGGRSALMALQRLQTDLALAWNGNLTQRQGSLDPDPYAVEAMRVERARLQLNHKLTEALDTIAEATHDYSAVTDPLFVLPIDDIDLNPAACLDLLRLLRLISVPRLFTLVLGDLQVAELVLNLKSSSDFGKLAREALELSVESAELAAMAGEVAAHSLRKLVPPGQRVNLRPMSVLEGLNFRPLGRREDGRRLYELLRRCPIELEPAAGADPGILGERSESLFHFLLTRGFSIFEASQPAAAIRDELAAGDLEHACYSARHLFQTAPRPITDLWLSLSDVARGASSEPYAQAEHAMEPRPEDSGKGRAREDEPPCGDRLTRPTARAVIDAVARHCLSVLAEEPAFSPAERRAAGEAICQDDAGVWKLGKLPLTVAPAIDPGPELEGVPESETGISPQLRFGYPGGWRFETGSGQTLETASAAAAILCHDLLALGPRPQVRRALLGLDETGERGAVTEWSDGQYRVALPWSTPPCASFWELDLFLHSWNDALRRCRVPPDEASVRSLAFAWLAAGTAVVDRGLPLIPNDPDSEPPWPKMADRLGNLVAISEEGSTRSSSARRWLIDVALLLMPEIGLPADVGSVLTTHGLLTGFWKKRRHSRQIWLRRRQWLAEIMSHDVDGDMGKLGERLRSTQLAGDLESESTLLRPGSKRVTDDAKALRDMRAVRARRAAEA